MALALEIVFAAALAVLGASLALAAYGRAPARFLLAAGIVLAFLALAGAAAVGLNLVQDFAATERLLLATGGLAAAALGEGCLYALARGLRRVRELERVGEAGRERLEAQLADHAEQRKLDLQRTLARERA